MSKIGMGLGSQQIADLAALTCQTDALELEDFLNPAEFDRLEPRLAEARAALRDYHGELLLSGPYIDLNPASPDALVQEACRQRFRQALDWAKQLGAREIIFCSTFIPIIYLEFYEADWARRSADFWSAFLDEVPGGVTISLCNTFEFDPRWLVWVAGQVNRPNFRLALDLGHFLVYARIGLEDWLRQTAPFLSTVYVHSNHGQVDEHLPPGEGLLSAEQVQMAARYAPAQARFVLKPFEKTALPASLAWLRRVLEAKSSTMGGV